MQQETGLESQNQQQLQTNADLQYVLDLFDKEELKLTISQDTEDAQRTSTAYHQEYSHGLDVRVQISESRYRNAFSQYFKEHRSEAIGFIDAAIKFMNKVRKIKVEDLMGELDKSGAVQGVAHALICPQLLVEPIQDELQYGELGQNDKQRYKQILVLLKSPQLNEKSKSKIQQLLQAIESK